MRFFDITARSGRACGVRRRPAGGHAYTIQEETMLTVGRSLRSLEVRALTAVIR